MKKSVVALLLILVLFSSSVFALDVAITPVKDKFFPGEQVEFAVTIFNQDSAQRSYEIKTLSYDWVVISGGGIVKLNPLSSKEFIVALEPRVEKQVGRYYNIDLLVKK